MDKYYIMNSEELKALQKKNLEIAEYFTQFCKRYSIRVFLCGGACLGAIRHKGFIPWDDDMDFFMPAHDFERLKNIWPKRADVSNVSSMKKYRKNRKNLL